MIVLYVHRLAAYEYCPARYKLEVARSNSEPTSKFEVYQMLFKQYFRSRLYLRQNTIIMEKLVNRYSHILFPKGESISAEVMVAYVIKCFEKLYYQVKNKGNYLLPDTFEFQIDTNISFRLVVDMIFTDSIEDRDSIYLYRKRVNFVYLVPKEYWDPISLSNRLEGYITYKLLLPKLRNNSNIQFKIIYLNAEDGRIFEIPGDEFDLKLAGDKSRLNSIVAGITGKNFCRKGIGALCNRCPEYKKCAPREYETEKEYVEITQV